MPPILFFRLETMELTRIAGTLITLSLAASSTHAVDPFSSQNPAHFAGETAAYLDLSVFLGSDVAPVRSLLNGDEWLDKYDAKKGENLALATGRIEAGVAYQGMRFGYILRQEWQAKANKDTLNIYHAIETKSNLPSGQKKIAYDLEGWSAHGIQAGISNRKQLGDTNWNLDLGLSISLLEGKRMRKENWSGRLSEFFNAPLLTDTRVSRTMSNMEKDIFNRPVANTEGPNGRGFAGDIGISLGRDDGLRLDWTISDAFGRMKWDNLFSQEVRVEDNYIAPKGNWQNAKREWHLANEKLPEEMRKKDRYESHVAKKIRFTQKLKPKHAVTLSIPVNQAHVEIGDSYRDGQHFPRIGVRQHLGNGWGTRIDYDFRLKSVGLALAHKWLYLNYQTDHLNPEKAKVQGLALGARIPF